VCNQTKSSLPPPEGNAGFYQVVFTSGGGIHRNLGPNGKYVYTAHGQIAFFGDFGNDNNQDLAKCWKFLNNKCVVNYGIRGYVCNRNQTVPNCRLECELYVAISSAASLGQKVSWCRRMSKCNLAECPNPKKCLGSQDIRGCSPVANLNLGERIVYQLFDVNPSFIEPDAIDTEDVVAVGWIIGVVVALVVVVVGVVFVVYYMKKKRQGGNYFWRRRTEETM